MGDQRVYNPQRKENNFNCFHLLNLKLKYMYTHFGDHGTVTMGRYQNYRDIKCVRLSVCETVCPKWDNIKLLGYPVLIKLHVQHF